MKKLFFLFAASALLVACSSDDQADLQGGNPVTDPTEDVTSAATIEFENGTALSVSAEDKDTPTRAAEAETETCDFVINLNKLEEKFGKVMNDLGDYKLKVDDFAIRIDGEYTNIEVKDNNVKKWDVNVLSEQDLKVAVKNLGVLDFTNAKDYTYEVYLWIENKTLLDDGTGGYGELFTDEMKSNWIQKAWPVAEGEETGLDLSEAIWLAYGEKLEDFFTTMEGGYLVRYNVYRGLSGLNGDTPYIKVSVHVEKQDQTTVGEKKNDCTWVRIPYEAK